jgi:NAD-dependent SIR2 family protein deacetylase
MTEKPKIAGYECPKCHKRYKIKHGLQVATITLLCPCCYTPIVEYHKVDFDPDDYDWPGAAGG